MGGGGRAEAFFGGGGAVGGMHCVCVSSCSVSCWWDGGWGPQQQFHLNWQAAGQQGSRAGLAYLGARKEQRRPHPTTHPRSTPRMHAPCRCRPTCSASRIWTWMCRPGFGPDDLDEDSDLCLCSACAVRARPRGARRAAQGSTKWLVLRCIAGRARWPAQVLCRIMGAAIVMSRAGPARQLSRQIAATHDSRSTPRVWSGPGGQG